jgi:signal transduction histidine kinase
VHEPIERCRRSGRDHFDVLTAVVLTVVSFAILAASGLLTGAGGMVTSLSVLAFSALVAGRRRRPIVVAVAAGALLVVPELTSEAHAYSTSALALPGLVAVFLYAYTLGAHCAWAPSLIGLAALIVGVAGTAATFNPLVEMVTIGPWIGGLIVASRQRAASELELRVRELEAERELFASESVRYERARIARELHDIVAHCVSLMVVQASAGEQLAPSDPSGAAEAFDSISEAARQAEVEIDRLVDLLADPSPASASAGLRIVDELVGRVRASGLTVTCQFIGDIEHLSDESADAAYRLAQEGVTNAIKHAPGAPIEITVRGDAEAVEVQVENAAAAGASSGLEHAGGSHGLAGMRERVARCGGTFSAGPTAGGGWQVTAEFPRRVPAASGAEPLVGRARG